MSALTRLFTLLQSVRAPTGKSTTNVKETAAAIARESAGTPWLIELACSLIDDAQSDTSNGGLCLDDIFWQKVAKLPEATRNLLDVISVAGRPLFEVDAFQAAGLGAEGQDALEQLRLVRSRLLRTTGVNRDKLDNYHDRVRETVLRNLPAEKRKEYHRRIASVLEFSSQADPEALATQALAKVIRASIAANRGDNQLAATLLDAAATAFDSANMRLFAMATRRQLGGLIGNDQGRTLVTAADDFMKEQGIQDSVRITNMLVPGFSKSPNQ